MKQQHLEDCARKHVYDQHGVGTPFPRSRMPASIEKSLKLVVCLMDRARRLLSESPGFDAVGSGYRVCLKEGDAGRSDVVDPRVGVGAIGDGIASPSEGRCHFLEVTDGVVRR